MENGHKHSTKSRDSALILRLSKWSPPSATGFWTPSIMDSVHLAAAAAAAAALTAAVTLTTTAAVQNLADHHRNLNKERKKQHPRNLGKAKCRRKNKRQQLQECGKQPMQGSKSTWRRRNLLYHGHAICLLLWQHIQHCMPMVICYCRKMTRRILVQLIHGARLKCSFVNIVK